MGNADLWSHAGSLLNNPSFSFEYYFSKTHLRIGDLIEPTRIFGRRVEEVPQEISALSIPGERN